MYLRVSIVVPELLVCMAGGQCAVVWRSITATTSHIWYLVKNQFMDMPEITQEETEDTGKAEEVIKVFEIFQTGWVVLEIVG